MRTSDDYINALVLGVPLPPNPDIELPLPDSCYVCWGCKTITSYWEPGNICESCEQEGERQQMEAHDES